MNFLRKQTLRALTALLWSFFLVVCSTNLYGQGYGLQKPPAYQTSPVVKILIEETMENGSGLLIGNDGNTAYILTAAHVVWNEDEEPYKGTISAKIQEFKTSDQSLANEGYVPASIVHFNSKMDVAVLSFEWSQLPKSRSGGTFTFPTTKKGFSDITSCSINEMATLKGFSGGSESRFDEIELMIQGIKYYDDDRAFRMEAESVEGGHSGGPVYNSIGEWIGMMQEINGAGTACKVMKLNTIINEISGKGIPTNLLSNALLASRWVVVAIVDNGKKMTSFPPTNPVLSIDDRGLLGGLGSGNACIKNKQVIFSNIPNGAIMLEPIHDGSSSFNPHIAVLENDRPYELNVGNNPLSIDQIVHLKLKCDTYELWLSPARAMGR